MKLALVLNKADLSKIQYPILVEMWKKVMNSSMNRRKYEAEFNQEEREIIGEYYKKFYTWYVGEGLPEQHTLDITTLDLLHRAIDFFATIE